MAGVARAPRSLHIEISDAFGTIAYKFMWSALSWNLRKFWALPLIRLLLGTRRNVQWTGHTGSDRVAMGRGGRRGTVDTPPLGEVYLEYTIGRRMVDTQSVRRIGAVNGGWLLHCRGIYPPYMRPNVVPTYTTYFGRLIWCYSPLRPTPSPS